MTDLRAVRLVVAAGAKPPVRPNFQVAPDVLKSYAGSYFMGDAELKFDVVDGKLTGGEAGDKPAPLDAIDQTTFQHSGYPSLKMSFNVENGQVVSVISDGVIFVRAEHHLFAIAERTN